MHASYKEAVEWIAAEDGDGDDERLEQWHVAQMVTVALIADLWRKNTEQVARDILRARIRNDVR